MSCLLVTLCENIGLQHIFPWPLLFGRDFGGHFLDPRYSAEISAAISLTPVIRPKFRRPFPWPPLLGRNFGGHFLDPRYSAEISAVSWPHARRSWPAPLPGGHIQVCKLLELYISWHLPLQDFCPQTKLSPTMLGTTGDSNPLSHRIPPPTPMAAPPTSPPPPICPKHLHIVNKLSHQTRCRRRVLTKLQWFLNLRYCSMGGET